MIGVVLEEKYRVEKKIGEGGFARVYKGFDINLEREVAVKVLKDVGSNESFVQRFRRESQSLAKLSHPNIVTLFGYGEYDGMPYQIMELVDGYSLHELLIRASLSPAEICDLSRQVCRAMAYAHGQGVVHRDLTLKNIMVAMRGEKATQVKVVDFGLAKLLRAEIQTTGKDMMGTPSYMSPEQVKGEMIDGRTDIWAFGVGLYRMLNGHFPFESEHPTAVMYLIVNEPEINFTSAAPVDLMDIVVRCLEKDPLNRPRGFAELVKQFDGLREVCVSGVSTQQLGPALSQPIETRSSKRNPYLNRVMIKNPSDFFGREREVRKIYSRLDAPHPQSISIVGDRRIGKSSLLNYIYLRTNRRNHMQNYNNAIFVYLDFQGSADFTIPRFIDFLFNVFSYETQAGADYAKREKTLDLLKDTVQELHDAGRRIIVLMDEFESITRNPNFDEGFFSFLRALANSYRVAFVTSSCDELQHMCHNKDISDSPFFNIFSNLPLRPFKPEAAMDLITIPSKTEGVPLERHAEKIIEMAGYFPLYLQIACSCAFENLLEGEGPDWGRIARTFIDETAPHYGFEWERMGEPERENLYRLAEGRKISRKYEFVNDSLFRRGYLKKDAGGYTIFSESFKQFVLQRNRKETKKKSIFGSLFGKYSRDTN